MDVLQSLQKPKKITIRGSDGNCYTMMCKPKASLKAELHSWALVFYYIIPFLLWVMSANYFWFSLVTSRGIWNVLIENTRNRRWHWDAPAPPQESRLDGLPIVLTNGASLARFVARWSSAKNLQQNFFQLGTLNPHGINESFWFK